MAEALEAGDVSCGIAELWSCEVTMAEVLEAGDVSCGIISYGL